MKEDGIAEEKWKKYTINRVLPKDFDPIESVMIIVWRETFSYLSRMGLTKNDTALVIGTGGNSLSFVDHLKNLGIKTVVVGSDTREKIFLSKKISK